MVQVQMIIVAIIMVSVAVGSIVWLHSNMAAVSATRLTRMKKRIGIDSGTDTLSGRLSIIGGKELRRRCRRCPSENLCERWLAGKVEGGNTFCPNAEAFRNLAEA